jgi:site-specific recombinase XerD
MNDLLNLVLPAIGIEKKITAHCGRKTFSTHMIDEGWSEESLEILMGHENIETTKRFYIIRTINRVVNELKVRKAA